MNIGEDGFTENSTKYYPKVYLCDPDKNHICAKTICYKNNKHPEYGECRWSRNPENSIDGKTYIYDPDVNKVVEVKK